MTLTEVVKEMIRLNMKMVYCETGHYVYRHVLYEPVTYSVNLQTGMGLSKESVQELEKYIKAMGG